MAKLYRALVDLLIPQGPGVIPSSVRVKAGDFVEFDGSEPIDVGLMLRSRSIKRYIPPRKKKKES